MRETIGLFGGAFKPYNKGHDAALRKIAAENDKIYLFVSTKDRIRKGEFPIYWNCMKTIWENFISKTMPMNLEVIYAPNPTTEIFNVLSAAEMELDNFNTYQLYASNNDLLERYPHKKFARLFPRLWDNGQIEFKKTGTRNIMSGTKMRFYLQNNDVVGFTAGLPNELQKYGQEIFDILYKGRV